MKYSKNISMRLPSSFLLFVLFYASTINVHSQARCIDKEKQALLDFKLSFDEDSLASLSTWRNDSDDCCLWDGVLCDQKNEHVTTLLLCEAGLKSNKLRPSLLELQHLTWLHLCKNQFPMKIPKFIGSLTNLISLDLSESEFFGEIPPQLGNLSELQSLDLSESEFFGEIPPQLGNLAKLQDLDLRQYSNVMFQSKGLYSNRLQWLSGLSSIEYLKFAYVNLSNAVDWASALKKLPNLYVFECRSCSLPTALVTSSSHVNSSTSLQELDIPSNNLNSLPFEEMMFPLLNRLDASTNKINQSLPEILCYLPTTLTSLDLSSNFLNGVIVDAHFSKFPMLGMLALSDNNFLTFNFSKSWVPPFQLFHLDLSSCKVGPNFPHWVLTQTDLRYVHISNSGISGVLPESFWEFSDFGIFNLSHNQISGMVPNSNNVSTYTPLLVLDLSYNAFNGPIPFPLVGSPFFLFLSNNKFSSFPYFHHRVVDIETVIIDVSNNNLSGTLPGWLFQSNMLSILNLANNKLSGALPTEIGSLQQLFALHLSNNLISGELPLSMKNCTQLVVLELANNKISGVVPSWLGETMPNLSILTLRSNNFSGNLPVSLCYLQNLQIIDLSQNRLSGIIPSCLHNFSSMAIKKDFRFLENYDTEIFQNYLFDLLRYNDSESIMWKGSLVELDTKNLVERNVMNLSGNYFRGEIPIGVTTLKELKSLDLSMNYLNGTIPDKIGELTSLELLKLSSNGLCGEIPQSLAALTFLGTLNLSNNNLSGRIPTGTQLQGFDPSSYAGNPKLCGKPLPTKCPGDKDNDSKQPPLPDKDAHDGDDESFNIQAFLAALGMGFAVGFLGILASLHFNRPWRVAFFQLVNNIAEKVIVTTYIYLRKANRATTM